MPTLATARSILFAPGSDEGKLRKALASDAHGIVCDLEDGVAPGEKETAREAVRRTLATTRKGSDPFIFVRVNGEDTDYFAEDVRLVGDLDLDGIVLPKATPDAVDALGDAGPPVVAIVETAVGLRLAYETARKPRVAALALGAADLGAELGLEPRADGLELLYARSALVVDSAAAGIRAPFDVVHLEIRDEAGLAAECRMARSLGLGGKLCIHPAQVATVNEVFAPPAEDVAWAQKVLEAYEDGVAGGRGAVALEGQMIDLPVVERARRILAEAKGAT